MNLSRNILKRLTARLNVPKRIHLLNRIHSDERGGVSIETVLILGAIALPIVIFILKVGWPAIQQFFTTNIKTLQDDGTTGGSGS